MERRSPLQHCRRPPCCLPCSGSPRRALFWRSAAPIKLFAAAGSSCAVVAGIQSGTCLVIDHCDPPLLWVLVIVAGLEETRAGTAATRPTTCILRHPAGAAWPAHMLGNATAAGLPCSQTTCSYPCGTYNFAKQETIANTCLEGMHTRAGARTEVKSTATTVTRRAALQSLVTATAAAPQRRPPALLLQRPGPS